MSVEEKKEPLIVDKESLFFALSFVTFNTMATMLKAGVSKEEMVKCLEDMIEQVKAY